MTATNVSPPTQATRRRPLVGISLLVLGAIHVLVAPLVVNDSLQSILDGGVAGSIEADPELVTLRGYGFWYLTAGLAVIVLGAHVLQVERATGAVPRLLGWLLVGLTVWGVVLAPLSPFWAFLLIAGLAFRSARR